ncbi:MAG: hypothetical protein AB7O96_09630 [Pseudobdellovibrionaceae bacterium]
MLSKSTLIFLFLVFAFFEILVTGCTSGTPKDTSDDNSLNTVMKNLKGTLGELIPLVSSTDKYADKNNKNLILEETHKLQQWAHRIPKESFPKDPQFAYMSAHLEQDLKLAMDSYQLGQAEYSRSILKSSISNCIGCHTTGPNGPQFQKNEFDSALAKMRPFEKAEFQTSLRQYEPALKNYLLSIQESDDSWKGSLQAERAAKSALAITVRFMNSPEESLKIADSVVKNPNSPAHLKQMAEQWKLDIATWKVTENKKINERPLGKKRPKSLLSQAESLSSASEIGLYRRQALLTKALASDLTPKERSQAYFLMGSSIDASKDLAWGGLSDVYYETCIRSTPHTTEAESCYERLEDNVTLGFSGSSGVNLPPELKVKLDELKALAKLLNP